MTQADRVLSTPPTNTSATNPPGPVDTTRRHFLTVAAGASVASVGTLAVAAIATGAPPAALAVDPIYAAIERHKAAALIWDAAVNVRADFPDTADARTDEQQERLYELESAVDETWGALRASQRRPDQYRTNHARGDHRGNPVYPRPNER